MLRFAEQGEVVTDRPERTIRILADLPELCLTWTRYVPGEEGPGPAHPQGARRRLLHPHRRAQLRPRPGGRAGEGRARAPSSPRRPNVIHTFRNDGPDDATWLNFHAPSKGFANFLRDPDFVWDSFDAPADGGAPALARRSWTTFTPHRAHNM